MSRCEFESTVAARPEIAAQRLLDSYTMPGQYLVPASGQLTWPPIALEDGASLIVDHKGSEILFIRLSNDARGLTYDFHGITPAPVGCTLKMQWNREQQPALSPRQEAAAKADQERIFCLTAEKLDGIRRLVKVPARSDPAGPADSL